MRHPANGWAAAAALGATLVATTAAAQATDAGSQAPSPGDEPLTDEVTHPDGEDDAEALAERAHFSHPDFGFSLALGWAVGPVHLAGGLNDIRTANGYPEVTPYATGLLLEFGVEVYRFTAELGFEVFDLPLTDGYSQVAAVGTVGYRLTERGPWLVTPALGYGAFEGHACFGGNPAQQNDPTADSFTQVVQNPGPSTCMKSWRHFVRASFALDYRVFLTDELVAGRPGFFVGLRVDASLPLGRPQWSLGFPDDDLPSFEGPVTPIAGWTVGIVGGFTIGLDGEQLGASAEPTPTPDPD